jgi:adenylylsulfate kinase
MELFNASIRTYVLDGDDVRHGINGDLGFSREERGENLRRIVELSKLFVDAGILVLAAFLSPYKTGRDYVKKQFEKDNFLEIYVKCSRRYPRACPWNSDKVLENAKSMIRRGNIGKHRQE